MTSEVIGGHKRSHFHLQILFQLFCLKCNFIKTLYEMYMNANIMKTQLIH